MPVRDIPFLQELTFKTSRSSGSGGQHVNKVESKVELNFKIADSELLEEDQKSLLLEKLSNRINKEGVLQIVVEEGRSQRQNKQIAIERFLELVEKALKKPKYRKPTKPGRAVKEKRLKDKKELSEKKERRRGDKLSP